MGDEAFDEKILTEKLTKLNSSQQSIESLSKWCVTHRKKAKQVVETWEKLFKSAQRDQQVSFLYLANDILQNSRRQGSEYVNEFWKVLPSALKGAYDSGHQSCRKVVLRLVDIWGERKVFGSRGQNLKNDILGKNTPSSGKILSTDENPSPAYVVKKPSPNPIKVVKKDENALRVKLAVGCLPEKILSAFQLAHEEIFAEEGAFTKCKDAVSSIQELENDVVAASSQGSLVGSEVVDDIQKQESILQQCINQLENSEAIRAGLVSHLKEAVEDQESKLELIRNELVVARSKVEQVSSTRLRLTPSFSAPPPTIIQPTVIPTFPPTPLPPPNNPTPTPPTFPSTSFTSSMTEEANTKATAAAMAAKLAASASSAQMLTSIFSSLVAEEAASISYSSKRAKLEHSSSDVSSSDYFATPQQSMISLAPDSSNQLQAPFLPPHLPQFTPPDNAQAMNYGYDAANLQGLVGPDVPVLQDQQQAQLGNGGYYRPVGAGFYGQTHHPSTPPMHRQ